METEIFSWSGWDGDAECMVFYEPELKIQVGEFPPGTKFDNATVVQNINGENYLEFSNLGPEVFGGIFRKSIVVARYKIHMRVGEKI